MSADGYKSGFIEFSVLLIILLIRQEAGVVFLTGFYGFQVGKNQFLNQMLTNCGPLLSRSPQARGSPVSVVVKHRFPISVKAKLGCGTRSNGDCAHVIVSGINVKQVPRQIG